MGDAPMISINPNKMGENEKELVEKKLNIIQTIASSNLNLSKAITNPIIDMHNMISNCIFNGSVTDTNKKKKKKKL
jgi:hypothetical protein